MRKASMKHRTGNINRRYSMKKLLAILSLVVAFSSPVFSQTSISIGHVPHCPNGEVLVPVTCQNLTNVGAISLFIAYDPASLTFLGVTGLNPALNFGFLESSNQVDPTTFGIQWMSNGLQSANLLPTDTLFYARFDHLAGSSTLDFVLNTPHLSEIYDFDGNVVSNVTFNNGSVDIPAAIAINPGGTTVYCVNDLLHLTTSPAGGGGTEYSYLWSGPGGFTATTQDISIPDIQLIQAGIYSVIVTEDNSLCNSSFSETVIINPIPLADPVANFTICNGNNSNLFTFTGPIPGTVFSWTNDNPAIGLSASGTATLPVFQAVNNGTSPVDATITVTPSFTNAGLTCTGPSITFTITVNPSGHVNDPTDLVVCNGQQTSVTFSTNNTGGTSTYAWSYTAPNIGTPALSGTGNIADFDASNLTTAPIVAPFTVTPTFTNQAISCTGPSQTFTISVNPLGQVIDPSDLVVCHNQVTSVTFSTNNTGGTSTYAWSYTAPNIGTAALSGTGDINNFNAQNTTTAPIVAPFTVIPTFTNQTISCPGPSQTFTITVNPLGQVVDPADLVVCHNQATSVTFSTNNTGGTSTYAWSYTAPNIGTPTLSGTGNIAGFNALNTTTAPIVAPFTVIPTFTNQAISCPGPSQTFTITVNPLGQVVDPTDLVVCHNQATSVTFSTNNTGGTSTYAWSYTAPNIGTPALSGTGDITSFNAQNNTTAPIVAPFTVIPTFTNQAINCPGPSQTFTITVNPLGQVVDPTDLVVCHNQATSVNFSTNNTGGTSTYAWSYTAPNIGTPALSGTGDITSFNAQNTTTAPIVAPFTVIPTFTNLAISCPGPSQTFTITVNPLGQVVDPTDLVVCHNQPTSVTFSSNNTGGTSTYAWSYTAPNIGTPALNGSGNITSFNAVNTTTAPIVAPFTVIPTFTNLAISCPGPSQTFTITVNPLGQVVDPTDLVVCHNQATSVTFSTNNTGGTNTYAWSYTAPNIGTPALSGTGDITSFNAQNITTAPIVAPFTVIPTFTNLAISCPGPSQTFTITVNPLGQVFDPTDLVVCHNQPTSVTFSSNNTGGTSTYAWSYTAPNIGTPTLSGTGNITSFNAQNTTIAPIVAPFTVIPTFTNQAISCPGPSQTFSITVNPLGQVVDPTDLIVCNNQATSVTFSSNNTGGASTYAWSYTAPNIGTPALSGTGSIASFNAQNTTTAPIVAPFTVIPTFTNQAINCTGPSQTFTITVNPLGQVIDPTDQVVCNGQQTSVTFSTNNTGGTSTYSWSYTPPSIGVAVSGSGDIPSFTASNGTSTPVVAPFTVIPTFTNLGVSCPGPSQTFTITVNPAGQVNDPADIVVCSGDQTSVSFSSNNTGGTVTYSWSYTGPNIGLATSGSGDIPSFAAVNATTAPVTATFTVTPTFTNQVVGCPGIPQIFTITVNPIPTVNNITSTVYCHPQSTTPILFTGPVAGTSFSWVNSNPTIGIGGSGTGNIASFPTSNLTAVPNIGTFTVTPSFSNLGLTCTGPTNTFTITVNPRPIANAGPDVTIPMGTFTTLSGSGSNSAGPYSYTWSPPGMLLNSTLQNPTTVLLNATQVYTLIVTDQGTLCQSLPDQVTVIVFGGPLTVVPSATPDVICYGDSTLIEAGATGGSGLYTYTWTSNPAGFTSSQATFYDHPTVNTWYICSLYDNFTTQIDSVEVTVNELPIASPASNTPICDSAVLNLSCPTTNGLPGYTYLWSAPNGWTDNVENPVIPMADLFGNYNTTYTVIVTDQNNCHDTATTAVFINPKPTVDAINNITVCNSLQTQPLIFTGPVPGTTFTWTNSDPTIGIPATGNGGILPFAGVNTGNAPVVATITVTPHANGCDGNPKTFTITVYPTPTINTITDQTYCHGDLTLVTTPVSAVSGTTFAWTNSNPSIGLAASGVTIIPSFTASNTTNAPVSGTITITPTANGCVGIDNSYVIDVNPIPTADPVSSFSICNTFTSNLITITGPVTGTLFTWSNSDLSIGLAAGGTGDIPSFTAVNTGSAPVTATITVIPSFTNAGITCTGPSMTFTITVNPTPSTDPVTSVSYCHGSVTSMIPFSGPVAGTAFNWTNSNTTIGLAASGLGNIPSFTATNTTNGPETALITVTPSANTCVGADITFNINVNPIPTATQVASFQICNSFATNIIPLTGPVAGTVYTWTNDDISIGLGANGTGDIPSFTATNTTSSPVIATITVTPSYSNAGITCTGPAMSFTITVNPTPSVNAVTDIPYCHGSVTSIVDLTGPVSGTSYAWTNSNTNIGLAASGTGSVPSFTASNSTNAPISGTITVVPTANACVGPSIDFDIIVNPIPTANQVTSFSICNTQNSALIPVTGPVTGTSYSWTNDNISIGLGSSGSGSIPAFTASNLTNSPVTATIQVTPSFTNAGITCTGPIMSFTITVNPTPSVDALPNISYCNGTVTSMVAITGPVSGTTFAWTNSNPLIGLAASGSGDIPGFTATNTGNAPITGTITITPTANTCSGPSITFTITVNPVPTADLVSSFSICNQAGSLLIPLTGPVTGTVYNWTNDNTGIGLAASGTGDIPGFTAVNTGTSPVIANISVTPVFTNAGISCTGSPMNFTITVNPTPTADQVNSVTYCNNISTTAIPFTSPVSGTTYMWTNSIPAIGLAASGTGDLPSFTATNPTTAPVIATITVTPSANGCPGPVMTFTITVNPTPSVDQPANADYCNGEQTQALIFSGPVAGTTFTWSCDNTAIGLAANGAGDLPVFTATNTTNVPLLSTISVVPEANLCQGFSKTFTITVYPTPTVDALPDPVYCNGNPTSLIPFTGPVSGTTFTWTNSNPVIGLPASGNGDIGSFTATNPTNAPITATITITPTANGCIGIDLSFIITVNPTPTVDQIADQDVCNNTSLPSIPFSGPVTGTIFDWTVDDPTIGLPPGGSGDIPIFSAINLSNVPVIATVTVIPKADTCTGPAMTFTITVYPTPSVDALANVDYCNGDVTTIIPFTGPVAGTSFTWSNDNTSIGLIANGTGDLPSFTATNTGTTNQTATITITPEAMTCLGSDVSFTITVYPTPTVEVVADFALCNGDVQATIPFSGPVAGTTFAWTNDNTNIGLGASGNGDLTSFTATNTTNAPITATITVTPTANGCTGTTMSFVITVNPTPTADQVTNQVVCNNGTQPAITLSGPVSGTLFSWTNDTPGIGLAANATGDLPSFTAVNLTNAPVIATITVTPSANNCTGPVMSFTITVNPTPTADQLGNLTYCNQATTLAIPFTGPVTGSTFSWTNSDPAIGLAASGIGTIPSFTATNTGIAPIVATIMVTPHANNCDGPVMMFTITVNPTPTVDAITNKTYCNGATTTIVQVTGPVAGTTFSWVNDNPSIGLLATGTGDIPSFTATNTGTTNQVATITITPNANSCPGPSISFTITVYPTPTVNTITNKTVCNNNTSTDITVDGPVAGTTFSWVNNTPSIGLAASGTGDIPSFTAVNLTTGIVTATITITPTANGCTGTTSSFTITVYPTPTVTLVNNIQICNQAVQPIITLGGPVTGTTFSWTNDNTAIGLGAGGSGNIPSFTATNTGTTPIVGNITVVPSANGCTGPSMSFTITVNPTPTVNAVVNQVWCNTNTTTAINFSSPVAGTSFSWTNSNITIGLGISGVTSIPVFTATNTTTAPISGTVVVTPTANTCVGPTLSFTITVNPTPTVTAVSNISICNGATQPAITFASPVTGTTFSWTNSTPSIGLAAGPLTGNLPSFTATNATAANVVATINVTPTYSNAGLSCTGPVMTFTITVKPTPSTNTVANQTYCNGVSTTAITFNGPVTGTTHTWANSNTAIGLVAGGTNTIPVFTTTNATNAPIIGTITVTPSAAGCTGSNMIFTITVNPTATATQVSNQQVCNGSTQPAITFGGTVSGTTYTWTNSNTSIGLGATGNGNLPSFTATNTTTAPVVATISVTPRANGCDGTVMTFTITVNPTPTVTTVSDQVYCNGISTTAISFMGTVAGTSFGWTNSNTAIGLAASGSASIPVFTTTNTTTAPISGTIVVTPTANSCTGSTMTFTITVNPTATVTASSIPNQTRCHNTATAAVNFTGPVTGTSFNWTNNNTTIGLGASGPGNIASFTATNTTTNPVTATITVTPVYTNAGVTCNGTNSTFTITVNPLPVANAGPDQTINYGTYTTLAGSSTGCTNCGYVWQPSGMLSTSNTITNPTTVNLTATQAYNLVVTNLTTNCQSTRDTVIITITGTALAVTVTADPTTICNGSTSQLTATATGGNLAYTYTWSPAATLTSSTIYNPVASPTTTTTYYVTVNDGFNNVNGQVTVTVVPYATVDAGNDTTICANDCVTLNQSTATNAASLVWTSSGDGIFSSVSILHPEYCPGTNDLAAGTVNLSLTAFGNTPCGSVSSTLVLTISEQTGAYAGVNDTICEGSSYTLSLASVVNATSTTWTTTGSGSFDDPLALNPTYFPSPLDISLGAVTLSLHAVNTALYCGDTTDQMVLTIIQLPHANAGSDVTICFGDQTQLNASGGTTYAWSPPLGLSATNIADPFANPFMTTEYIVTVTQDGCSDADSVIVTIRALPVIDAGPDTYVCRGDSTRLEATLGFASYTWSNGATTPGTWVKPLFQSVYYVTVYDDIGCHSSDSVTVAVQPLPNINVTPPEAYICRDSAVLLTASGANLYYWSPSTGLSSGVGSVVLAFPKQHTLYQVTGVSIYGCINYADVSIRVYPTPRLILNDTGYICLGEPFYLNAGFNDSTSYQWQNGSTGQYFWVEEPNDYWVTAWNPGCMVSDTIHIDMCTSMWIPTAFTPDGNETNDRFYVKSSTPFDLKNFEMVIYDRWGEIVFKTKDIFEGWDGTFQGKDCPIGVYIVVVTWDGQGNVASDKEGQKTGTVTLVR